MVAQRFWRTAQDAGRTLERLGAGKESGAVRSRGPLLGTAADRLGRTYLGGKLADYSAAAHPGELFSDVLAWGLSAVMAGALLGWLVFGRALPALLIAAAAPMLADRVLLRLRGSRAARIEKQLPDALVLQASALRAGQSLIRSIRIVAEGVKPPLRDEVVRLNNHLDLGMPVDDALEQFAARTSSKDVDLWVDAMLVHRQTGGNLANVIESLADRVSQRVNLRLEIRALTAQGRLSGLVVAAAPLAFFVLLSVGSREQMEVLYTTPMGLVILFTGLALNGLGLFWIKMVLRIKP
jgi:tight adherence protein B